MFSRISVPTPFQIGPVNAYLAGRTIVDPGPDSEEAWSKLLEYLESESLRPADVTQVLVTHPHPDHFGMAHRFRDVGARVVASAPAASIIGDFAGRLEDEQSFFMGFFQRCGLAETTARTITALPESFLPYAPAVETDETVEAGDEVAVGGTTLTVDAVQGHAAGELIFEYMAADKRRAIVGDQVLPHTTPNPFLLPPSEHDGERPRVLPAYNRSLERLRSEQYDRFLPGHGDEIPYPAGRIDEIRSAHESRTDRVRRIVDGPTTPVDVMQELFEDLPVTEQFSGLSEAVGHLDVLEAREEVVPRESGHVLRYEPAH